MAQGEVAVLKDDAPGPKELGFYLALAQIGLEMVAPIGLGVILDYYLRWGPWGVIAGAVFGLIGGFAHMVLMLNRQQEKDSAGRRRDSNG
jgi:F0F1-type ATP synthase assembly protein I